MLYASVLLTRENPNEAPDLVSSDHGADLTDAANRKFETSEQRTPYPYPAGYLNSRL